ncbi:MAG: hypothetical protein H6Q52_967 [Deltaproteobacteria bacterium]|nr:hypothetical protein [Deltaproteobacteria bacterium]
MNGIKDDNGFTLVELIMFIVIGAIFLPASLVAFTSVMNNYSRPDYYMKARFYAEKRMSEVTNRFYDNITPAVCIDETQGGYTIKCSINDINSVDLSTTNPTKDIDGSYYTFRRITVTVQHSGLLSDYVISTIVTRRPRK